jgi:hypothetical protein
MFSNLKQNLTFDTNFILKLMFMLHIITSCNDITFGLQGCTTTIIMLQPWNTIMEHIIKLCYKVGYSHQHQPIF